jgi:uncharacterized glyoxalase superfamily protein PhnB
MITDRRWCPVRRDHGSVNGCSVALTAGATALEPPLETPYGDRRAMVRDPFSNVFQVAHQIAAT